MKRPRPPLSKYRAVTAAWHPSLLERERQAWESRPGGAGSGGPSSAPALGRRQEIWMLWAFDATQTNLHNSVQRFMHSK